MRIVNLIENTQGQTGCAFEHGLSFYIETSGHKALLDLGQTEAFIGNAAALGVDLKAVDTVILSHGHYDHSGGILPFSRVNSKAPIYMQSTAGGEYYADDGKPAGDLRYRYIGIDKAVLKLPQVKLLQGDMRLDEELELFTLKKRTHDLPFTNRWILKKAADGFVPDDFLHEQYLVVKDAGKTVLLSGCAHNGILSILDAFCEKYGSYPDVVVSGFHLMLKREYRPDELEQVRAIASALKAYPSHFYTCHCTGTAAYEEMKTILGDRLSYIHSGDTISINF